jgi:hypothetical protein
MQVSCNADERMLFASAYLHGASIRSGLHGCAAREDLPVADAPALRFPAERVLVDDSPARPVRIDRPAVDEIARRVGARKFLVCPNPSQPYSPAQDG